MIPCKLCAPHSNACCVCGPTVTWSCAYQSCQLEQDIKMQTLGFPNILTGPNPQSVHICHLKDIQLNSVVLESMSNAMDHFIRILNENTRQCRHTLIILNPVFALVLWDRCYLLDWQHQNDTYPDSRALKLYSCQFMGPTDICVKRAWMLRDRCQLVYCQHPMILILTAGSRASVLFAGEGVCPHILFLIMNAQHMRIPLYAFAFVKRLLQKQVLIFWVNVFWSVVCMHGEFGLGSPK